VVKAGKLRNLHTPRLVLGGTRAIGDVERQTAAAIKGQTNAPDDVLQTTDDADHANSTDDQDQTLSRVGALWCRRPACLVLGEMWCRRPACLVRFAREVVQASRPPRPFWD
jgi:hypothetical protein